MLDIEYWGVSKQVYYTPLRLLWQLGVSSGENQMSL